MVARAQAPRRGIVQNWTVCPTGPRYTDSMGNRSEQWRQRASELRALAENQPAVQRALLDCARSYEEMAKRAEDREAAPLDERSPSNAGTRIETGCR